MTPSEPTPPDLQPRQATGMPASVSLRGITKSFAGAVALRGVDLEVRSGEVHALCGENGAGKSTLMGVLGGSFSPDAGSITLDGTEVRFLSPSDALTRGIAVIHQEFSLVGPLSVAENIYLGQEPRLGPWIRRQLLRQRAREHLAALGFPVDPNARAEDLPTGQRQLVEIAKALSRDARVLVLDEPTAALTAAETQRLFQVVGELRTRGLAIIYISHHLDEVAEIADRITVLRDGRRVGTWRASELSPGQLIEAMVGEAVDVRQSASRSPLDPPLLIVSRLTGRVLGGVDVGVRPGEIVGLTGLAGAGHEELARILVGADRSTHGSITWEDRPYRPRHPLDARRRGVAGVPADRRREGLIPTLGLGKNLTLTMLRDLAFAGLLIPGKSTDLARQLCRDYEIVPPRLSQPVLTFSGGNQQKALLARELVTQPRLLILNDPTRGIDVKTREAVHRRIEQLANQGLAIVLVTSDTQELLRLADRVLVLRDGLIVRELDAATTDEHQIIAVMTAVEPSRTGSVNPPRMTT